MTSRAADGEHAADRSHEHERLIEAALERPGVAAAVKVADSLSIRPLGYAPAPKGTYAAGGNA